MGQFGSSLTPQEAMKQAKRDIDHACRDLDRERRKMEQQQTKLETDIKKAAKSNQMAVAKIMAKDYVRTKKAVRSFMMMRTQLQALGLQMQTMRSTDAMATAMKNTTKSMVAMNRRLNLPQLQAIMRSFGIETERMEATQEIMGDAIDDVLGDADEEEEGESIVQQVFEELKLDMSVPIAPSTVPAHAVAAPARVATGVASGGPGGGSGGSSLPPPSGGGSGGAGAPPAPPGGGGGLPPADFSARLNGLRGGGAGKGGAGQGGPPPPAAT